VDQTLASTALTSTTNVIMHGMEGQGCGDEIVGDFECGNVFVGEEGEMSIPLHIASQDLVKGGIEMRQQKCSALSVRGMLEYGYGHHQQSGE
jgi:hypothetical protein